MVMVGLITSQVACAGKVQRISGPLNQTKFPENYTYTVKLKTEEKFRGIQTNELSTSEDQLNIKTQTQEKSLMFKDIEYVYGESNQIVQEGVGSGALMGGAVGAGVGVLGGILFSFALSSALEGEPRLAPEVFIYTVPIPLVVGLFAGTVAGSQKTKKKILITPTVTPTKQGSVDAGVNVGVKF